MDFYFIFFLKDKNVKYRKLKIGILIFLIITIPLSRLILGVHYLTDVLGGITLGLAYLFALLMLYESNFIKEREDKTELTFSFKYAIEGIVATLKKKKEICLFIF